jgi:hypothetical protein
VPTPRRIRSLLPPLAALAGCLALLSLTACGSSNESLAKIQGTSGAITKPMLNHWMRAMAGGDFRSNVGTKSPLGLVSEPANYSECATAADKLVPRSFSGQPKLTHAQILQKCRELHSALKAQAMSFLLSVQWTIAEGEEVGLKVSDALLHKEFQRYRKEVWKTPAKERAFLSERHWVLSDVLYQLKRNILVTRMLPAFEAKVKQAGGGEQVYAKLATQRYNSLIAKTKCKPGYVVQGCKGYREPSTPARSPAEILEGFVQASQ